MVEHGERQLQCVVVTPERAVLGEPADYVALPMYDGSLGVLPGRAPLIGRLGYGELRIRRGEETQRFFVDGGFAQVGAHVLAVVTPRAGRGDQIHVQAATGTLETARVAAVTPEAQEERAKAQE